MLDIRFAIELQWGKCIRDKTLLEENFIMAQFGTKLQFAVIDSLYDGTKGYMHLANLNLLLVMLCGLQSSKEKRN